MEKCMAKFRKFIQVIPAALYTVSLITGILAEQKLNRERTNIKNDIIDLFKELIKEFTLEN
ncbi:hypothetical protein [Peribacillus sp. SCS-155]|uniref:hypothetical protein n=1 Tax=Peribacillus sedimenti TaxID=3115297 RepID=UPI0039069A27